MSYFYDIKKKIVENLYTVKTIYRHNFLRNKFQIVKSGFSDANSALYVYICYIIHACNLIQVYMNKILY